jgi:dihydroneopterin aldolase
VDEVFVRALEVPAILGIYPHERTTPQPVRISFTMYTDIRAAAASDTIADALDYANAAARVTELAQNGRFNLAETLAERIAELLLGEFRCDRVQVEVEKPAALAEARGVGVRIERARRRQ